MAFGEKGVSLSLIGQFCFDFTKTSSHGLLA